MSYQFDDGGNNTHRWVCIYTFFSQIFIKSNFNIFLIKFGHWTSLFYR